MFPVQPPRSPFRFALRIFTACANAATTDFHTNMVIRTGRTCGTITGVLRQYGREEGISITSTPRLVIAGTHSGSGKTTMTLGLMAAYRQRGLTVQGFKVGPDYIDPGYHTSVTGRLSHNLDSWMTDRDGVREILTRSSQQADLSIIEGVMGYYDGKSADSNAGSAAEIAELTASPVVLVVDVAGMARSAAAVVRGFQAMDGQGRIVAVLVNRAGSLTHYHMVQEAIESVTGIPVCGYLRTDPTMSLPERHLGLLPAIGRGDLNGLWERFAQAVQDTVNLDKLWELAKQSSPVPAPVHKRLEDQSIPPQAKLAVARDAAFNFYYPENFDLLRAAGFELEEFSPLAGEPLPEDADAVYLGGGFPEEFLEDLSRPKYLRTFRAKIGRGMPVVAECGGYMYLGESIVNRAGAAYPMVGRIPMTVTMQDRLSALGYREIEALCDTPLMQQGEKARGHEFHYSTQQFTTPAVSPSYRLSGRRGSYNDGFAAADLASGYTHLYFMSNPAIAVRFSSMAAHYRDLREREGC